MSTRLGIQRTSAIVAGAWLNRPDVRNAVRDVLGRWVNRLRAAASSALNARHEP